MSAVYALLHLKQENGAYILAAPEAKGRQAYAYDLNNHYTKIPILSSRGGTMSLVAIPDSLSFLATEKFFPPFVAAETEIVASIFNGTNWESKFVMTFPYLHRFDLVTSNGEIYFIGATITESKKYADDWENPGYLFVGKFDKKTYQIQHVQRLDKELHTNHGYCPMRDKEYSLITAREGIFKLNYPTTANSWKLEQVYQQPISDIVPFTVSGETYYAAIEKFHGEKLIILDKNFEKLYAVKGEFPFAHSLWAGEIGGRQRIIFGHRGGKKNYYEVDISQEMLQNQQFSLKLVDPSAGSTNTIKFDKDGMEYIASANREINEFSIYKYMEE